MAILTNSYGAEYGRGGGSVTNVIYKGGTNRFHGSAWELATNSVRRQRRKKTCLQIANLRILHPVSVENMLDAFGGD